MKRKTRLPRRRLAVVAGVALPVVALGPCSTNATDALINGFLNALTPILVDELQTILAVESAGSDATTDTGAD